MHLQGPPARTVRDNALQILMWGTVIASIVYAIVRFALCTACP
jgi:hypothetical protein